MAFPPQFLDELRARLPLSDIVGKRMRLIRAGREFKAPCPFHNEKTPSFYVNDAKGFFHCFGCGAHGDVVGFVMRHDNLGFVEAVESLAGLAGLPVPQSTPEDRHRFEKTKGLHDLVEAACRFFEEQLRMPGGRAALEYLRGRGLDDTAIANFRLGYAPADRALLRNHLIKLGFTEDDLVEAGVCKRPEGGGAVFSFFRNRVMFPVADRRGRIVAFGGRIMDGDGPKYLNSADNPLFHKGRLLYNMSRARVAAGDGEPVVVVEGYMDVIALVRAGWAGAVAPLGTALTETQILELWKLCPPGRRVPVLCFDGDNAGRRAAWRAVDRILPHLAPDHSVRVAFLPEGEDPDSLLRKRGTAAMKEVLDAALPLAQVIWDMEAATRTLDTPEARAGFEAALEERVKAIADRTVQAHYRTEMRRRIDEAFGWKKGADRGWTPRRPDGNRQGRGGKGGWRPMPPEPQIQRRRPTGGNMLREKILLATLVNHPELFEEMAETLATADFKTEDLADIRAIVISVLTRESGLDAASLYRHLCDQGFSRSLDDLLGAVRVHAWFARLEASTEEARAGLRELWGLAQRKHIEAELQEAGQALARDMSEANNLRLKTLKQEVESDLGEDNDPASE